MAREIQNPETVSCTIDGVPLEVPKGTRMIDACAQVGVDIAHYCYHPGLSAPAQCRQCLVEVEGMPKLMPACVTIVGEGNAVLTQSDKSLKAREANLEFYLLNHPLDCPVCDQSGECKLQDYVAEEGAAMGRLNEPKRILGIDDFGGDVLYYGDRCIMCTRCVRFMREVAQDERLGIVQRGDRNAIDTFFDQGLEGNIWADNVIDICPVGSLVSKDFLHKARAWDLDRTPSICPGCSQGCNITLQVRDNEVMRLKPRPNEAVNGHWMCDHGRLDYAWMNRGDRIEVPMVRDGEKLIPTSWSDALVRLAELGREGNATVRSVVSPLGSNEDLGAARRLLDALGGGTGVYRAARGDEVVLPGFPQLALREDRAANTVGADLLGFVRAGDDAGRGGLDEVGAHTGIVLVVGDDLADASPDFGRNAALFIYVGQVLSPAARNAHFVLPATTFAEMDGSFTNISRRVQRFWPALKLPGMARPAWQILGVLHAGVTGGDAPATADQAFAFLGQIRPEFGALRFADLGAAGIELPESAALAGSAGD